LSFVVGTDQLLLLYNITEATRASYSFILVFSDILGPCNQHLSYFEKAAFPN